MMANPLNDHFAIDPIHCQERQEWGLSGCPIKEKETESASDPSGRPASKAVTPEQRYRRKNEEERKLRLESIGSDALAGSSAKTFLKQYQAAKERDRDLDREQSDLLKALEYMKLQEKEKDKDKDKTIALKEDGAPIAQDDVVSESMVQISFN